MRILVICREFPLPLTSGEKIRCYYIIKGLAKRHEVSLISLVHQKSELKYEEELKQYCKNIYPFDFRLSKKLSALKALFSLEPWDVKAFYKKEMKIKVRELVSHKQFDIIWINFLSMAYCLDNNMTSKCRLIFDQHNVDELVWRNYARNSNNVAIKLFASMNMQKVKFLQQRMFDQLDTIVCVSKEDENYMKGHIPPNVRTWLIPNGVDTDYFIPVDSGNHKSNIIMLCASMDVTMNIDASLQFARKAFPIIKRQIPNSEFWIVGRNPAPEVLALARDRYIKVTGTVEDLRPYYGAAKVIVAPYRLGGGTKLKVLEAMAMNLPIVSTTSGCHGIDVSGSSQIIIKDDMEDFAEAVVRVLKSDVPNKNGSEDNARGFVEERYSWKRITEGLEKRLTELAK